MHALYLLGLALLFLPVVSRAQAATGVGFAAITIHDPVNGGTMPGYVFYPSAQAKGVTWIGPYELHATRDAPAMPGAKPLVVISHGHGGSDLDLHDLAVYLASHGFITATLQHPKDNYLDTSGAGTPAVWIGRPIQVKATITHLLDSQKWKELIDPNRIGVAGFSAGGYAALMIVGAVPDFERYIGFCKRYPDDQEICPSPKQAAYLTTHRLAEQSHFAAIQKQLGRWGNTDDPRVRAAFAEAPFSMLFDRQGLASIDCPVFLYYAQDSHILPPEANALHIAPLIRTLAGIKMVPHAEHFVFLSPCSAQQTRHLPRICKAPPGVDRVAVHRQIDANALAFFRKTLDVH